MAITFLTASNSNPITMAFMGLLLSSGMSILPFFITEYLRLDEVADRTMNFARRSDESYDFIVGKYLF